MDTGLNNTNTLHITLENSFMEDVEWIIEATDEERHQIWRDYHEKHDWKEVSSGQGYTILKLKVKSNVNGKKVKETLPICISFSYAILDDHKIMFYSSDSRLTHHGYVESFLLTYFQRTHHNYTRWNHVNSTNFHNCAGYLNTIDENPRNTVYKPNDFDKKYHIFKPVDKKMILNKKLKKVKNTIVIS